MLVMGGRTILNIRDFQEHFSLADALRQHRAFACFAVRISGRMDDASRAMSMLFALGSMQLDGRINALSPSSVPYRTAPCGEMMALLRAPLPAPEEAHEHVCSLAACFAQEKQTMQLLKLQKRTPRAAAEFAEKCDLPPAEKKILFLLIVSACRLAGAAWERAAITPRQAAAALRGEETEAVGQWACMPDSGELLLEEREEPWKLLVHPAWKEKPSCRMLPEGSRLDTVRIRALPHARGSTQHCAAVQFFCRDTDDVPCAEAALHAGEYVTVTVLRDSDGLCMPLPPRPETVMCGRHVLRRADRKTDALLLNEKRAPLPAGAVTGFAPDGSGGYVALVDGRLEDSAFVRRAFLLDFLLDVRGERFIDVAVRDGELALLCPDGRVLSSYDYLRTERPLIVLDDYFA